MARGRRPTPGKVYYLGRLRFRPGIDPPELQNLLENLASSSPVKRADMLRATLLGGAQYAMEKATSIEDDDTGQLLSDFFADF